MVPLVARPRPACAPLEARVSTLCDLARTADRDNDTSTASTVFNQAALLASDLDLPTLAREWCHRHATLYLRGCPLPGTAARHALEPLVNLARLQIRAGSGNSAFHLLNGLYEALKVRTDTVIDGLPMPFSTLARTADDHQDVLQWLWRVLLADGTRALTSAGRWCDALVHLRSRNGVGDRILDGRQVAVIANAIAGDTAAACALLATTAAGEPWENAVTACLAALCRPGDNRAASEMLDRYRRLDHAASGLVVFRTRLGLSVVEAIGGARSAEGRAVATTVIIRAVASDDGYAARDVLTHPACSGMLQNDQTLALSTTVRASGLGLQRLPEQLGADLAAALSRSELVITRMVPSSSTSGS